MSNSTFSIEETNTIVFQLNSTGIFIARHFLTVTNLPNTFSIQQLYLRLYFVLQGKFF
jgi:hypothetical protein